MRISILTGALNVARDHKKLRQPEEWLPMFKEAGYDYLDIGLTEQSRPDEFFLAQDDWEKRALGIKKQADELGIKFVQCHLPFIKKATPVCDPIYSTPEGKKYYEELVRRAYVVCAILEIPFGTQHPFSDPEHTNDPDYMLKVNHDYWEPFIEYGAKQGVGTAFENMRPDTPFFSVIEKYCLNSEELVTLIDSFGSKYVGACWDTGHANDASIKHQSDHLRRLGHRLKNTHLNDNHFGARDQHMFPYMGENDWDDILRGLIDIDFAGVLNYEVGVGIKSFPEAFQPRMLKFVHDNGMYMLNRYEALKKEAGK